MGQRCLIYALLSLKLLILQHLWWITAIWTLMNMVQYDQSVFLASSYCPKSPPGVKSCNNKCFTVFSKPNFPFFFSRPAILGPSGVMANKDQIKQTAIKVLGCVEKVSSFASSIDPLFGIVTSLVVVARKGLGQDEVHEMDGEFRQIHEKLESISQKNQQTLRQIRVDEVNETFGKYEEYIKHQYAAFNTMVERVKKDPEQATRFMEDFENIYERDKSDMSLDVYYRGVMGTDTVFGRPLLKVYLDHCEGNRKIMEARCSHIAHLFHIGLMALMAYTAVTEDDEDVVKEKWAQRVSLIQDKMLEILKQCKEDWDFFLIVSIPPLDKAIFGTKKYYLGVSNLFFNQIIILCYILYYIHIALKVLLFFCNFNDHLFCNVC